MKITKEMLAGLRLGADWQVHVAGGVRDVAPVLIGSKLVLALLDERKALREALGDLVEWVEGMPDEALRAAEIRSALALGEDEE